MGIVKTKAQGTFRPGMFFPFSDTTVKSIMARTPSTLNGRVQDIVVRLVEKTTSQHAHGEDKTKRVNVVPNICVKFDELCVKFGRLVQFEAELCPDFAHSLTETSTSPPGVPKRCPYKSPISDEAETRR